MSSRVRPYLDLKKSVTKLFRTTARWLHDYVAKESVFEKPYLDQDYRKMHLNIPKPDWPTWDFEGGAFPPTPGTWTFKWDPGICTLGVASGRCGESVTLGVSVGLLPPGSIDQGIQWSATSSDPDKISVSSIEQGISGTIHLEIADGVEGTVTICAQGKLLGKVRKELTVQSPFSGTGSLDYRVAANLPALNSEYYENLTYNCGCTDIEITCLCVGAVWDTETSAETVGASSSCTIAIIEPTNSWKTWTVSGTGFWLNAEFTITSLYTQANSVTLYTDVSACGSATIQVCGATGYVRCTTGDWIHKSKTCELPGPHTPGEASFSNPYYIRGKTEGNKKQYQKLHGHWAAGACEGCIWNDCSDHCDDGGYASEGICIALDLVNHYCTCWTNPQNQCVCTWTVDMDYWEWECS